MKRIKRVVSLILIILAIVINVLGLNVNAIAYDMKQHFDTKTDDCASTYTSGQDKKISQTFIVEDAYILNRLELWIRREDDEDIGGIAVVGIYNTTNNVITGNPLASKLIACDNLVTAEGGQLVPIYFNPGVPLVPGIYAWMIIYSGTYPSPENILCLQGIGSDTQGYVMKVTQSGQWVTGFATAWFATYEKHTNLPVVVTLVPTIYTNNQVKLEGYAQSLGDNTKLRAYIEYGLSDTYGDVKDCGIIPKGEMPGGAKFEAWVTDLPVGETIHFRAYVLRDDDVKFSGADKTFILEDEGFSIIDTIVDTSTLTYQSIRLGVFVYEFGNETSLDLTIDMGTDYEMSTSLPVALDVTEAGGYYIEKTNLTGNTVYYVRAKAVGSNGTYYASKVKRFQTLNPGQPGAVQDVTGWLGGHGWTGEGFWWLIIIALTSITWAFLHEGMPKILIATTLTIGYFGAALALSLINPWLVGVLALVCGFIVFGIIFKR